MIIIVDYNAGNLRSVQRACEAVGLEARISADPAEVRAAQRVIFPGVGAAWSAMDTLNGRGLTKALRDTYAAGTPILGICLGAQIILDHSEEGDKQCVGLVPGNCVKFRLDDPSLKIPHIGWNGVRVVRPHPVLEGITEGDEFYFVHSYHVQPADPANVLGVTDYGGEFCSILGRANLIATQFHLEKSGRFGLELLRRFAAWNGEV